MAMGITQALKLQEGSISSLAMLPQQQILALAQQGRIPADMVSIILNEKADMAQTAANMQAAAAGQQPSITEQNLAVNAQSEQPQAAPSVMPMEGTSPAADTGIASLSVPDDMYSMAGGGIVAFEDGGTVPVLGEVYEHSEVPKIPGFAGPEGSLVRLPGVPSGPFPDLQQALSSVPKSSAPKTEDKTGKSEGRRGIDFDRLQEIQEAMLQAREQLGYGKDYENYKKYLQSQQSRAATEDYQDRWMRVLQAGLGILGGESPYAFTNIGKGAQAAAAGAMEDIAKRRKEATESMKARAELERLERAEKLEALKGAENLYGKEMERLIAAESRSNEMKDFIRVRTNAAILSGDKRPRDVIESDFAVEYQKYRSDPRMLQALASMQGANVAGSRESTQDYEKATEIVNNQILGRTGTRDPRRDRYKELLEKDKKNKDTPGYVLQAPAYKDDLIRQEISKMRGGGGSTSGSAPQGGASAAPAATAGFSVVTPGGTFTFPTKQAADAFKATAGIK